jgi:prepilin-type N-terminal cleavage/methylation domain-containing protein/prepilin-type processing-associated H-X9-DG protein
MKTPPQNRGHSHGFTLIELLVVIAIIGILVGLIMPAFKSARQAADEVKALSNLRTIGVGILEYANDHHGNIPSIYTYANTSDGQQFFGWLNLLCYDHYIGDPMTAQNAQGQQETAVLALQQLYDPVTHRINPNANNAGGWGINGFYTATPLIEDGCPPGDPGDEWNRHIRLTELTYPGETVLAADGNYHSGYWDWGLNNFNGYQLAPNTQVKGGANYLFCDGHVTWLAAQNPALTNSFPLQDKSYPTPIYWTPSDYPNPAQPH